MYFDRGGSESTEARGAPEYFNRKQKGGVGNVLAKACQMSEDLMGGKWKSIPFTAQDAQS